MFDQSYIHISKDLINLILIIGFSLVIGLELRQHHLKTQSGTLFGTDRTHVFIGLLGYILYILSPSDMSLYKYGGIALVILLSIYYNYKIFFRKQFGITTILVALITYSLPALLYTQPIWMSFAIVSIILVFTGLKSFFWNLTSKFDEDEFITLAKFLLISGIILPLLSHQEISDKIPVSPFKIWISVVVISGISYISYLLKKFVFPEKGALITGILGGLYSSTATTIVLAKKSKQDPNSYMQTAAAILVATGMMFIRIWFLALIFNFELGKSLTLSLLSLATLSFIIAWFLYRKKEKTVEKNFKETENYNPLEFKTALVFAFLFVFFSILTQYVLKYYGHKGLQILSFIVGVTDVDPFLLSLFTGKYQATLHTLSQATLIAITSNNIMKFVYAYILGHPKMRKPLGIGFGVIIIVSLFYIYFR